MNEIQLNLVKMGFHDVSNVFPYNMYVGEYSYGIAIHLSLKRLTNREGVEMFAILDKNGFFEKIFVKKAPPYVHKIKIPKDLLIEYKRQKEVYLDKLRYLKQMRSDKN